MRFFSEYKPFDKNISLAMRYAGYLKLTQFLLVIWFLIAGIVKETSRSIA